MISKLVTFATEKISISSVWNFDFRKDLEFVKKWTAIIYWKANGWLKSSFCLVLDGYPWSFRNGVHSTVRL